MSRESADFSVVEAEEYVDVVGSSTLVHCSVESESSPSESMGAMVSCETQEGFLLLLAFP